MQCQLPQETVLLFEALRCSMDGLSWSQLRDPYALRVLRYRRSNPTNIEHMLPLNDPHASSALRPTISSDSFHNLSSAGGSYAQAACPSSPVAIGLSP